MTVPTIRDDALAVLPLKGYGRSGTFWRLPMRQREERSASALTAVLVFWPQRQPLAAPVLPHLIEETRNETRRRGGMADDGARPMAQGSLPREENRRRLPPMSAALSYQYDSTAYPPFAVTVDLAVFTIRRDALQVLLIERGGEPFQGALALPGGFVQPDEDLSQAAARELAEETGLGADAEAWHLEQLASYGAPDRDPRMRVVTVAYLALCAELPAPRHGGDAAAAALTPVEEIERGAVRLAFDHERIVREAVERTRSKFEYTALAARFCPSTFTIGQLRRVYEVCVGGEGIGCHCPVPSLAEQFADQGQISAGHDSMTGVGVSRVMPPQPPSVVGGFGFVAHW